MKLELLLKMREFIKKYLDRSWSFEDYIATIDDLLSRDQTTGDNQAEVMVHYTRLNRQRMKRLEKTTDVSGDVVDAVAVVKNPIIWLIVTEAWCGDAAQNIPVIEKIAELDPNITTRYILRDRNPELMDAFLTDGARSIPKLIAIDPSDDNRILGTWGPRPAAAQDLYRELKNEGLEKEIVMERLQRWYNSDDSRSIQAEFAELVRDWGSAVSAKAAVAEK